uniref:Uncharacterized protein n=1 Tax=Anguilla anguilla TaxID=7936 RepID=A0A0E9RHT1_ANGAN
MRSRHTARRGEVFSQKVYISIRSSSRALAFTFVSTSALSV